MTQNDPALPLQQEQPVEANDAPTAPAVAPSPAEPTAPAAAGPDAPEIPATGAPMSGPYRMPPCAELAPFVAAPAVRVWPVMGSSLWVFGMSLWAFVVAGELTTSYAPGKRDLLLSEHLGALFVFVVTVGSWVFALRRMQVSSSAREIARTVGRAMAVATLSWLIWVVVVLCAMIVGTNATTNLDGKITVLLIALAAAAAIGGVKLAEIAPRERTAWRAFWIGSALITLFALVEVAAAD
jgi:hypothetical protein